MEEKVKRLIDLSNVHIMLTFNDNSGFVVPLTDLQGAFVVRALGFRIDAETGELSHYTDKEMDELYDLLKKD